MMFELLLNVMDRTCEIPTLNAPSPVTPIIESVRTPAGITPYPTGRLFWGGTVPGTSCQATITPSLRDISQQALASYHKLALNASSSVAGARPLCRLNAKRQISAHNAGNAIPTAAADFGSKLRAVIPGNVFASRHQN